MTQSAVHAAAFFREVARHQEVWAIRDEGGYPAPENPDGDRVMPFWSKRSRAEAAIRGNAGLTQFDVVRLSLDEWQECWLPGLRSDGFLIGVNWSGSRSTGYDFTADDVLGRLAAAIADA